MEEKKKQIRISDDASNYHPWLLVQNLVPEDDKEEHIFYPLHDPMSYYRCRIPELVGRYIRACFHGWMILSNYPHDIEWSLWNPVTSKFISLPPLILQDGEMDDIVYCCLSSPPEDAGSILLLTRDTKPNIVFCRLDQELLTWIEMSYSEQLMTITRDPDSFLCHPICCNGKVYAWAKVDSEVDSEVDAEVDAEDDAEVDAEVDDFVRSPYRVIQIDIVVKENKVVISLLPFVDLPYCVSNGHSSYILLRGSCAGLFTIVVGETKEKPVDFYLYKLDMSSMVWIEMKDLKNTVIFAHMEGHDSVYSSPTIDSKLSGYIHLFDEPSKVMYSCDVKNETISMSSMHYLDLPSSPENPETETETETSSMSITVWPGMPEFRFEVDNGETKCKADLKQVEGKGDEMMLVRSATTTTKNDNGDEVVQTSAARQLNIPFDVLGMIMEYSVGIEYLNFRATCKLCRLAAPMIQWRKERMRLQTYSLVSPWLMTLDQHGGIMTFTDPMFGDDKYFIKVPPELFYDGTILCSRYGWLLCYSEAGRLAFFNPFTSVIRKLPQMPDNHYVAIFCFSAPPTSPDCMIVGFSHCNNVYIHFVAGEPHWRIVELGFDGDDLNSFRFPTCFGQDVYAMFKDGGLVVLRGIGGDIENFSSETIVKEAEAPESCSTDQYFQSKCDQHHLQVIVGGEFGESVEVFKLNDRTKEWEKVDSLGKHVIYICDTTYFCMDAKIPEMENKIYFPRLHCETDKIVYYSMETRMYHTLNGTEENNMKDLLGTKQHIIYTQAWIEPTWS